MRALWLVGMMGSGKTEVGTVIARRTGLPLVDTDARIEAGHDQTITSIWETVGEGAFRDLEADEIKRIVTAGRDCVVATGGGAVLRPENVAAMRSSGLVVWLTAAPEVLSGRLGDGRTRPLLQNRASELGLAALLAERRHTYETAAHHSVDTGGKSPDEVAREVMLLWNGS
jgi:shikimate kinase